MEKIAVIFGGKSVEHDISVITGIMTSKRIMKNYSCIPIYIDGKGKWWTAKNILDPNIYSNFEKNCKHKICVTPLMGEGCFLIKRKKVFIESAVICLHGLNGEDGSVAGLMEIACIPYTSCGILSSAVTMDKAFTKEVLKSKGIKTLEHFVLKKNEDLETILKENKNLSFPLIVKPVNLGSSVGISVSKDLNELNEAIKVAREFDEKVLVEKFIEGAREFNCACFIFRDKLYCSNVVEVSKGEIFSFEEKYLRDSDKTTIVEDDLANRIKKLTKDVYSELDCFGIVRVDYLYKDDTLYVNEVNSIPGSLAFYLFNESFEEIIDLIISESKRRYEDKKKKTWSFKSDALSVFKSAQDKMIIKK